MCLIDHVQIELEMKKKKKIKIKEKREANIKIHRNKLPFTKHTIKLIFSLNRFEPGCKTELKGLLKVIGALKLNSKANLIDTYCKISKDLLLGF